MRTLSALVEATKDATEKCYVLLLEIDTATGTLYYANCMDNVAFPHGGQVYTSKSFMLDEITRDSGLSFPEASLAVANLDQALSYASLTRSLRGRAVRVKLVFINTATGRAIGTADDYIDLVDGIVELVELMEVAVSLTVLPALALLDRLTPVETYGPACPWVFGDTACGVTPDTKTAQTCDAGTTAVVITDAARTEDAGYWETGYVTLTSGTYIGEQRRVKTSAVGTITLEFPFPSAPAVGVTYTITQGCDKTFETCRDLFENETEYGGYVNMERGATT